MKKVLLFPAFAWLTSLALSGCFTIDTSRSTHTGEQHLVVSNYGWRLFYFIPLCCGNATPEKDRLGPWAFFRNDVTLEKVQSRFFETANQLDGSATDLTYCNNETVIFDIPFTNIPFPIPYFICYREIQLSGVVR